MPILRWADIISTYARASLRSGFGHFECNLKSDKAGKHLLSGFDDRDLYVVSDFADLFLSPFQVLPNLLFSLLLFNTIAFLYSTNEPLPTALDSADIIVSQLTPLLLDEAFELLPITR